MPWTLNVTPRAARELAGVPARDQARLRAAIGKLTDDLETTDRRKLQARDDAWRLRVGRWRVLYHQDNATRTRTVLAVRPRNEGTYR